MSAQAIGLEKYLERDLHDNKFRNLQFIRKKMLTAYSFLKFRETSRLYFRYFLCSDLGEGGKRKDVENLGKLEF